MTTLHLVPDDLRELYEVHEWRNATAVLQEANPEAWQDVIAVLRGFKLLHSDVMVPGGRKSNISGKIDQALYDRGWIERSYKTARTVDSVTYQTPTHSVDCVKDRVALEIEWNNKDPFFDRDLNNFRLLYEMHRVIDAGIIVTRSDELNLPIFGGTRRYGASTTHMSKLLPRIEGNGAGGCPVLVFGITTKIYEADA